MGSLQLKVPFIIKKMIKELFLCFMGMGVALSSPVPEEEDNTEDRGLIEDLLINMTETSPSTQSTTSLESQRQQHPAEDSLVEVSSAHQYRVNMRKMGLTSALTRNSNLYTFHRM